MRKLYESSNRKQRADQALRDANECLDSGYPGLAHVNAQIAAFLRGEDFRGIEPLNT